MPRVQFTVRTLMVAVALATMTLGPVAYLNQRRERFRALAALHAFQVNGYTIDGRGFYPLFLGLDGLPVSPRKGQQLLWHREMKWKYDQAVLRPWVPVPPDPPEPDWSVCSDIPPRPRKPATIEEAYQKSLAWGADHVRDGGNGFQFVGVEALRQLGEDRPDDGTEIGGRFHEAAEPVWDRRDELIPPKESLSAIVWERGSETPLGELMTEEQKAMARRVFRAGPTDR